jgi:hypothetical protein
MCSLNRIAPGLRRTQQNVFGVALLTPVIGATGHLR